MMNKYCSIVGLEEACKIRFPVGTRVHHPLHGGSTVIEKDGRLGIMVGLPGQKEFIEVVGIFVDLTVVSEATTTIPS
jgi:hypothetical protein